MCFTYSRSNIFTMNTKTLNEGLIEAIKEKIPRGMNMASVIMDTLYLGKEATYRRLRGEVPFSLTEASIISQSLGVSLDKLSGNISSGSALFGLNFIDYKNPIETYYKQNEQLIKVFMAVKDDPSTVWYAASNLIPQVFYMEYKSLSKFLLYKWMYQHEKINDVKLFSELEITAKLREIQKRYVAVSKTVATTCFIWDSMMFYHLLNDIRYFANIMLVSKNEIKELKQEILALLDQLEGVALRGYHKPGKKVQIYVSNINFEATYSYVETDSLKISFLRVFSINMLSTTDIDVFNNQKDWIHSLKRYSTLISESGEMQRIEFFNKQRSFVKQILG